MLLRILLTFEKLENRNFREVATREAVKRGRAIGTPEGALKKQSTDGKT